MENIKNSLNEWLDDEKIIHSLNVANTAVELALHHNVDQNDAYLAGLIHDVARNKNSSELLRIAKENNLIQHPLEEKIPVVLHAPVGAYIAKEYLNIRNKLVLNAVKKHTSAAPVMTILDKIIYIADVVEPGRFIKGAEEIKRIAKYNLEEAFLKTLEGTINYLIKQEFLIHPFTVDARNELILAKRRKRL